MKWILEIVEVQPYRVTCLWNDNVIRTIDLENFLRDSCRNPNNSYCQLVNIKRFSEVKCDGTSLYWENGIHIKDFDGTLKPAALDIDPDVLFEMTIKTQPFRRKRKGTYA